MEDLVKKISQYQIFNFLLSGTVLAFILSKTTSLNLLSDNILLSLFVYYFIGLIASRIGSLVVEPLYKKLRIVKFVSYSRYLSAVKEDEKIDVLSQENNTYRTLIGMLLTYIPAYLVCSWVGKEVLHQGWAIIAIAFILLILLSIAYRKQTKYIVSRVEAVSDD
jgi:hypothetical protein